MHWDPAHFDTQAGPRLKRVWPGHAAIIFLTATVLGFFFSAEIYFLATSYHREISWAQSLYWSFGDWYEWALMSPIIFWTCRTFRFDRASWPKSVSVHVFVGALLSGAHAMMCALLAVVQGWFTGKPMALTAALNGLLLNRTHYNLAVYALIVCAWYAWNYYRKFRERDAVAKDLSGRLAQAQLQALRMQLNPHFLFNTLNAVSSLMLRDVHAANKKRDRAESDAPPLGHSRWRTSTFVAVDRAVGSDRHALSAIENAVVSAAIKLRACRGAVSGLECDPINVPIELGVIEIIVPRVSGDADGW